MKNFENKREFAKKALIFLLAMLLILPTLAACNCAGTQDDGDATHETTPDETEATTPSTVITTPTDDKPQEPDPYKLRVLAAKSDPSTCKGNYDIVYDESTPLITTEVKNAIKHRNEMLQAEMNVEIALTEAANVYDTAYVGLYMGRDQYDLILPTVYQASLMAHDGYLIETEELSGIHENRSYYDQRALQRLKIKGKNYFFFSDITISDLDQTWVYYFNRAFINSYKLDDPYRLLIQHKWTLDWFLTLCQCATLDLDGTPTMQDDWGIVGNEYVITSLYHGTGEVFATDTGEGNIKITLNTPRVLEFLKTVKNLSAGCWARMQTGLSDYVSFPHPLGFTADDDYDDILSAFANGSSLFMGEYLATGKKLVKLNSNIDLGILPSPMLNEYQQEYFTPISADAACCAVPYTAEARAQDLSEIIERWAWISHNTVRLAYYEQVQNSQFSKQKISEEVVDIIFDSVSHDIGSTMGWGNLETELTALIWDGGTDLSTMYDRCGIEAENALNKFMEKFVG